MLMETEDEVNYFVFYTTVYSLRVSDRQKFGEWDSDMLGQDMESELWVPDFNPNLAVKLLVTSLTHTVINVIWPNCSVFVVQYNLQQI